MTIELSSDPGREVRGPPPPFWGSGSSSSIGVDPAVTDPALAFFVALPLDRDEAVSSWSPWEEAAGSAAEKEASESGYEGALRLRVVRF